MFSGNSYILIHTRLFSETKKHPIETDGVRYVPAPVTGPWGQRDRKRAAV